MKILVLLFNILIISALSAQGDGWKYQKTIDGINIYTKITEGDPIKEVKLQVHFNRKMSVVVAGLQDVSSYSKWVYRTSYSEKIKAINTWETIYYNYLDFPWPLTDRDVVVYNKIEQNPKTKLVLSTSYAKPDAKPLKKDIARISDMRSKWILKPEPSGVYAEYFFRSNPGGDFPAWAINAAIDEAPIKTIQGFKKLLESGQFDRNPNVEIVD
jgi:hypothetical protein